MQYVTRFNTDGLQASCDMMDIIDIGNEFANSSIRCFSYNKQSNLHTSVQQSLQKRRVNLTQRQTAKQST